MHNKSCKSRVDYQYDSIDNDGKNTENAAIIEAMRKKIAQMEEQQKVESLILPYKYNIKASDISMFLQEAAAGYSMTKTTYGNVKSVLHIIFDYAVMHDIVKVNVARQVKRPSRIRFKPQGHEIYTDKERRILMTYIEEHNKFDDSIYYAGIYIMFCLCCRIGEVKAFRAYDYNKDEGTINICREIVRRDGKETELDHTKSAEKGNRTQFLPEKACKLIEKLIEGKKPDDHIFVTETGLTMRTSAFDRNLGFACKAAGIPYKSSHKIRFWSVTALVRETGGDITAVGAYAGQACRQTTLHYIREAQDIDTQKAAAAAVFTA